ncbi:MAG: YtxH domain-containing protein [Desulfobacterales bacterium]
MILKSAAESLAMIRTRRERRQKIQNAKNLLIGASIGTAAGAAAGLLFAPNSGRKTREQISRRTGEALSRVRERVAESQEKIAARLEEQSSKYRQAAEACSEAVKEAVAETDVKETTKGKKK